MSNAFPGAAARLPAKKAADSRGRQAPAQCHGARGAGDRREEGLPPSASCSGHGTRAGRARLTCRRRCGAEEDSKEVGMATRVTQGY